MKIPYKVYPDSTGPLGSYLYSAVLNVQVALPTPNAPRTRRFEAIIDSGATRCLFHSEIARYIGVDLKIGQVETTQGIGGDELIYLHEIMLYLPGGPVKTKAGFKENLPVAGLLGMNGFFEFLRITFHGDSKVCEIDRIYRT